MWTTEDRERQKAATAAFMDRAHTLWHEFNGADAACNRCGTERQPAWLRRQSVKDLSRTVAS